MNRNEIQNQIEDLKKQMAELKEELNKPKSKGWKPKYRDTYYFITSYGSIIEEPWLDDIPDNIRYSMGNCFKTREEAEFEIKRLMVVAALKRFAEDHNESLGWDDPTKRKWSICANAFNGHIDFTSTVLFKYGEVYFSSKELAQQAVAEVGEDRVKKYYLEVED